MDVLVNEPIEGSNRFDVRQFYLCVGPRRKEVSLINSAEKDAAIAGFNSSFDVAKERLLDTIEFFETLTKELLYLYRETRLTAEGPCYTLTTLETIKEMRSAGFDRWDRSTLLEKQWVRLALHIDLDTTSSRTLWLP